MTQIKIIITLSFGLMYLVMAWVLKEFTPDPIFKVGTTILVIVGVVFVLRIWSTREDAKVTDVDKKESTITVSRNGASRIKPGDKIRIGRRDNL
jgi:protein-S-isoprenylcysteine O-methyltransferase Ste14